MMKMNSMRKLLSVILCMVLIAAMALTTTGCGSAEPTPTTAAATAPVQESTESVAEETGKVVNFTLLITYVDGKQTKIDVVTDQTTVGEALLEAGIIEGEDGPYGLYIKTVNGTTLDYDTDGKYWAFYIDGEYAMTGADQTEITPGATYELKAE